MLDLSRRESLGDALRDALLTFKSNVALLEADRHRETARYDYRALRAEAERVASRLQALDVQGGDRCTIVMSNQSKWVISGLGAMWAGAVLVPLDYKLTPAEQLQLIAHARPKALIVEYPAWRALLEEPTSRAALASLGGTTPALRGGASTSSTGGAELRVLVTEAPDGAALDGAQRWEVPASAAFRLVARARSDLASVVYSSGTGGTPKGCMLTHDNYLEQAQALGRMFPMLESDRYFSILPTNHAIDFMCGMVIPFLFGAAVVHQRTLRAEFLAPTMKRYGVTHTALVPRILRALQERIREQLDALPAWQRRAIDALIAANDLATQRVPNHRLSKALLKPIHDRFGGELRQIFAGGAFVEPELAEFFYRLGFPVVIGYGLTEACTVLTVNDLKPFRASTVGRPVAGIELELREVGADGVGEVYARGRTLMRGYLDAPELTREALVDGWLRTGDLGTIDASGHLRLLGRAKNMIVTEGGKNVYPEDVEAAFERVDCEELCVFSARYLWPEQRLGAEQLTLIVRARKGQAAAQLVAQLRRANVGLVEYKRVASYLFWDHEFPRTASMKIKRDELAQQVRAAAGGAALLEAS
jgi:long-chain acyl-CoA synthetase